ncbi:FAD-binding domain-containing protein [Phanerochaete sordida]|uniref:FAD-binding domain-containing protein n=1 Tax=Phanerochaete sordida TaxID=48140 RepID=A0A9P3LGJ6_9APHY|nr:FAD-binding domain-containing protein [Phanerochaete sordida]
MLHNDHTERPQGDDSSDETLTWDQLKEHLERQYQADPSFEPLLDLIALIEAPEVDYSSPEVQVIIDKLRAQDDVPAPAVPKPEYKVRRLFREDEEGEGHIGTKVKTVAYRVEGRTGPRTEMINKEKFWDAPPTLLTEIGDTTVVQITGMDDFKNWGLNVSFRPSCQLVVRSVESVRKVVKWAAAKSRRVRVTGFRHSWSEIFGRNGDVLIMFLPFDTLVTLPYQDPAASWVTELSGITPVASVAGRTAPSRHAFFRIMAGTTNEQFRKWCFAHKTHCLPFNVIMVEVTFGGTNAPICHGSSLSSTTLSDLVVAVEYVDAHGELRVVDDPAELRAASGAFGLLGVVVALTLQLENMGVTDMMPVKVSMPLAIPPPPGFELPQEVRQMISKKKITEAQFAEAQKEFERRCETDYYLEWFWFPYQDDCWVNTWSKRYATDSDVNRKAYPGDGLLNGVKSQEIQATIAEALVNSIPFRLLSGKKQALLSGAACMRALPSITDPSQAIRTLQSEAEHFRRGIQNFRCWDTEWQIPVPKVNGKPKYELIQRAWWDGIAAMYSRSDAPVRVALEMRLTGGSDVLLAPQRGNSATCAIEVLTTPITPAKQWATFMQTIADRWTSYDLRNEDGSVLHARPHWAKQWKGLTVHGKPVEQYLKEDAYADAFAEFRQVFKGIVERDHATVEETLKVFGNDLMVHLIFG